VRGAGATADSPEFDDRGARLGLRAAVAVPVVVASVLLAVAASSSFRRRTDVAETTGGDRPTARVDSSAVQHDSSAVQHAPGVAQHDSGAARHDPADRIGRDSGADGGAITAFDERSENGPSAESTSAAELTRHSASGDDRDGTDTGDADTASGRLRLARRARTRAFRAPIEERAERRRAAALMFRSVRESFPLEPELAAEAGFRAACEFAQAGDTEDAAYELQQLAASEAPATWRCRAWLELGHLRRRAGRYDEALDAYLRASRIDEAQRSWRDDASIWTGKTQVQAGDLRAAQRTFAWTTEHDADVFTRIRAYDEWALSWIASDDLESAAAVLDRCRTATREVALEATARGEQVRRRLASMRCIAALERAVQHRRRRSGAASK